MYGEGITQMQLADNVGTSVPYVNRIMKSSEVTANKTFIAMMERWGYYINLRMQNAIRGDIMSSILALEDDVNLNRGITFSLEKSGEIVFFR